MTCTTSSTRAMARDRVGARGPKRAVVTSFLCDGDRVYAEYDGDWNLEAKYTTEGPSYYDPLISMRRGGTSSWYAFDALGTTRALTDASQAVTDSYAYDAFGNQMPTTGTCSSPNRAFRTLHSRSRFAAGLAVPWPGGHTQSCRLRRKRLFSANDTSLRPLRIPPGLDATSRHRGHTRSQKARRNWAGPRSICLPKTLTLADSQHIGVKVFLPSQHSIGLAMYDVCGLGLVPIRAGPGHDDDT